MIKALRVIMIVYAAIGILFGLGFIFFPGQLADMTGMTKASGAGLYDQGLLGITWIVLGVFVIMAAREPLKNMMWVRFALAWAIGSFAIDLYSPLRGFIDFGQAMGGLIIDGVFAVLLLISYPWRASQKAAIPAKEPAS